MSIWFVNQCVITTRFLLYFQKHFSHVEVDAWSLHRLLIDFSCLCHCHQPLFGNFPGSTSITVLLRLQTLCSPQPRCEPQSVCKSECYYYIIMAFLVTLHNHVLLGKLMPAVANMKLRVSRSKVVTLIRTYIFKEKKTIQILS